MIVTIKLQGRGSTMLSRQIVKHLIDSGLKVRHWIETAPREVAGIRRIAKNAGADAVVVAMREPTR